MKDKGFICIWNDSLEDSRKEFSKEFLDITSKDDKEGIYTFFFSRFSLNDHKVSTDVLYVNVYENTFLFFWPLSNSLIVDLDDQLNVTDALNIHPDKNIMSELIESNNIISLGLVVSKMGHLYEGYTLKDNRGRDLGIKIFDELYLSHKMDIDSIKVSDDDIIDMTMEYLDVKIEEYQSVVDKSIDEDEADVRLNENPYGNRFWDKDDIPRPMEVKRGLGDTNV